MKKSLLEMSGEEFQAEIIKRLAALAAASPLRRKTESERRGLEKILASVRGRHVLQLTLRMARQGNMDGLRVALRRAQMVTIKGANKRTPGRGRLATASVSRRESEQHFISLPQPL